MLLTVATPPPVRSSGSFLTLTACASSAAISVMPEVATAATEAAAEAVVTMLLEEYSATEVTACSSCKEETWFKPT